MKLPRWSHWVILVVFGLALLAVPACTAANNPPEVLSLFADPPSVVPGQNTTLVCVVEDADGDALTFAWTYSGPSIGTILATETDSEVDWTVPEATGEYTVTVSVDDGRGGVVDASCSVAVAVVITEGSIDVKSSPSGARVYLDGVDTENITPYIATGVLEGEHTIKLTLYGYENREGTVTVEGGETKYVNWALDEASLSTVVLQPGVGEGKDTYVYAASPENTHGSDTYLFAGRESGSETCRSYIQFDLDAIPSGAVVTDAELGLYYINSVGTGLSLIGAYEVTSAWDDETMNWHGKPDSATNSEDVNTMAEAITFDWEYWDIDDLVQGWIDGSIANHGVVIKSVDETDEGAYKAFYSSEWGTDAVKRTECPKLTVTYYEP